MQLGRLCRHCPLRRKNVLSRVLFTAISTVTLTCIFLSRAVTERRQKDAYLFIVDSTDLDDARIKTTPNISVLHDEFFKTTRIACSYPKLTIDNQEIWQHLNPVKESKPECEKTKNWVYVNNGQ